MVTIFFVHCCSQCLTCSSLSAYAPRYIQGNAVSLSLVGMATAIYGFLWYYYDKKNKIRSGSPMKSKHENLSEEQLAELGDESPHYRYTI